MSDLIPLRQACSFIPSRVHGKNLHYSTLWRWASRGVRGVKLEVLRIGGGAYVTREGIDRFIAALNTGANAAPAARKERTAKCRAADIERAERACAAAGI